MRLLADLHIAPRTVEFLRTLGHDTVAVSDVLPPNAPDAEIVALALQSDWVILTQDLDFSDLIALSGRGKPSLIVLRLDSAQVDRINETLAHVLPRVAAEVAAGAIVSVRELRVRVRKLPIV